MTMRFLGVLASLSVFVLPVACSVGNTTEPTGSVDQAQISDIQSMQQRADGSFDVVCKNGTRQTVSAADIQSNRVCGGGGGGTTNGVVIYGRSDSCSTDSAVASVTAATDCMRLSDTDIAWSVSVNGQCTNISDTTVRKACLAYLPGSVKIFGRSDSCSLDNIVAAVSSRTNCNTLSDSDIAWSVSVDGTCQNISDTTVRRACVNFQPGASIIYGRSDSCDADSAAVAVTEDTDCQSLSDADVAWSVRVGGTCKNISDTTLRKACVIAQGGGF